MPATVSMIVLLTLPSIFVAFTCAVTSGFATRRSAP